MAAADSLLPHRRMDTANGRRRTSLYEACARNDPYSLQKVLERGVLAEEVMEVDINGRNGLMVACCKGFLAIVHGLHTCPFLHINHQDNEGNTALMIASQAGYISTVMYILNYYPGTDTEIRDCRGFTALIKAAMTGRNDIVAVLLMAGADIDAVDSTCGKCAWEWALKTGRNETIHRLHRLTLRPKAEQFCEAYVPEWPELKERVAQATADKSAREKITRHIKNTFGFKLPGDPKHNGVLDHMVRMTTSLRSPLVATGCHPICPTSPPELGKKRLALPELVSKRIDGGSEASSVSSGGSSVHSRRTSTVWCADTQRRDSILSLASTKVTAFMPRGVARRNSVSPAGYAPRIDVSNSGEPEPKREMKEAEQKGYLKPPLWKYKESRARKKKAKKAEKVNTEREKR